MPSTEKSDQTSHIKLKTRASRATVSEDDISPKLKVSDSSKLATEETTPPKVGTRFNFPKTPGLPSEPLRFSVRRDMSGEGSSIGRTVLYVIVVIVIGLGLVFLVQNYLTNQSNTGANDQATDQQDTEEVLDIASADIAKVVLPDSAADNVHANDLFTSSALALGSAANPVENVKLSLMQYQAYTSFSRLSWQLTGVDAGLPATSISYSGSDRTITVVFNGIDVEDDELLQEIPVSVGNVTKITAERTNDGVQFLIQLEAPSKYYAFVGGNNTVSLDIKTEEQLSQPTAGDTETETEEETPVEETGEEEEETPAPVVSGQQPTAPHYDNTASQSKQYIVSEVDDNSIISETYYYQDFGDSFQFSWAMRGGDPAIPNASAEYVTQDNKDYIKVTINNLAFDLLHSQGKEKAKIDIPLTTSNIVDVFTDTFSGGTAVFMVEIRNDRSNFKLHSTVTYNNYQLVSLQVYD